MNIPPATISTNRSIMLTIIIVTYNSSAVIGNLLSSLRNVSKSGNISDAADTEDTAYAADTTDTTDTAEIKIMLVDNASSDNTLEIARGFSNIEIIENYNSGYGRAANIALRKITTPYALLLNPDVIITLAAIDKMLAVIENNSQTGILGATMSSSCDFAVNADYANSSFNSYTDSSAQKTDVADASSVVGALMLLRMSALADSGLFDENIFLFYEENDLCRRMVKSGWRVSLLKTALAYHLPGNSTPSSCKVERIKSWHCGWSRGYYYRKHYSFTKYFAKCISKIILSFYRIIKFALLGNKMKAQKSFYELSGIFAYINGEKAFANNVAKWTV